MQNIKRLLSVILVIVVLFALCSCEKKYYDETNISELYSKEWIIGKSRGEIVGKYGVFNREYISDEGDNLGAYYVNYENTGMDPSYIHDTYFVVFDDHDIAIDAYFRKTSIGG